MESKRKNSKIKIRSELKKREKAAPKEIEFAECRTLNHCSHHGWRRKMLK